jgi:hypothetical protein
MPWRNFNVVQVPMGHKRDPIPLRFHLTGAWMEDVVFQFETICPKARRSPFKCRIGSAPY